MRKLIIATTAATVAGLSFAVLPGEAQAMRCKSPEKWNAVEGKCQVMMKKPVAAKVAKPS